MSKVLNFQHAMNTMEVGADSRNPVFSVLIFCQWKKMLTIIQRFMMLKGWKFGRLDGNTNVASRQRLVDNFNDDESYFAMLCTTRTGGVGLNLTGADRIILYDPDWNPQTGKSTDNINCAEMGSFALP